MAAKRKVDNEFDEIQDDMDELFQKKSKKESETRDIRGEIKTIKETLIQNSDIPGLRSKVRDLEADIEEMKKKKMLLKEEFLPFKILDHYETHPGQCITIIPENSLEEFTNIIRRISGRMEDVILVKGMLKEEWEASARCKIGFSSECFDFGDEMDGLDPEDLDFDWLDNVEELKTEIGKLPWFLLSPKLKIMYYVPPNKWQSYADDYSDYVKEKIIRPLMTSKLEEIKRDNRRAISKHEPWIFCSKNLLDGEGKKFIRSKIQRQTDSDDY